MSIIRFSLTTVQDRVCGPKTRSLLDLRINGTPTSEGTVLANQHFFHQQTRSACKRRRAPVFLPALVLLALALLQSHNAFARSTPNSNDGLPDAPDPGGQSQSAPAPAAQLAAAAQAASSQPQPALSFPAATAPAKNQKAPRPLDSCDIQNTGATVINTGALRALASANLHAAPQNAGEEAVGTTVCVNHFKGINWYARFTTGPDVKPMTVEEKGRLAVVNVMDPFNLLTIFGTAAISIAANSHSVYGPGVHGWAESSGVSFTQDLTGQFFGTFLIPAVTHTDPHYHRRPDLSMGRRIWHCVYQTFWQRADNRKETFNYSQILSPAIGIAFSNLYVPGLETHFSADAERYGVDLATAPIDNFITEFVPSIAARIHTHVVFLERIIDRVAVNGPGT